MEKETGPLLQYVGIQNCTTLTKENSSCPAGLPGLLIQQTHFSDLHRYRQKYKKTYAVHWFCRTILKSKRLQTTQMSINRKLVVQTVVQWYKKWKRKSSHQVRESRYRKIVQYATISKKGETQIYFIFWMGKKVFLGLKKKMGV